MKNKSLFDLGLEYHALNDLMQDVEFDQETGEIINNDEAIAELFNELQDDLGTKLNACKFIINENETKAALLRTMAKQFTDKAKALDNKTATLKSNMVSVLELNGGKIKTDLFSFGVRTTKAVDIINQDELGREYLKIKYEADKKKIGDILKDGGVVAGATLKENKSLNVR